MRMLNTRAGDIFGHRLHFDAFSTIHTETIDMRSRFDPLSRAFLTRYISDENAQRNSVDRRHPNICVFKGKAGAHNPKRATEPSGHAIAFSHTSLFLDQFSREF